MQAVVYDEFGGPLSIRDVPDPEASDHGVVIRVLATGLCRSDWHGWMGHDPDIKLPHVPGHELAGVVESCGSGVERFRVGDRVTVPFCVGCGTCSPCSEGHSQVCDNYFQPGFTAWGSFAERVAIPFADFNLVSLPETIEMTAAASLGCRFVTAYHGLIAQAKLQAGEVLAVHGCGGVGLAAIQIGVAIGARVIAVDVQPKALEWAKQLGAAEIVPVGPDDSNRTVIGAIRSASSGGAHVSLDAIGGRTACLRSIRCLRKRGRHVQVGLMVGDYASPDIPMARVIAHELQLIGSHGIAVGEYPRLLQQIADGQLNPGAMISESIELGDVPERLPKLSQNQHAGVTIIEL